MMSVAQDNHLRSPEEEDLIYRRTKKIKDGNSEVMDVEKEAIVDDAISPAEEVPKSSYRDKVMEVDSQFDLEPAEIIRMVTEELFPDLEDTKKTENLGKTFNLNPTVNVALEEYKQWCSPWKFSLIVRLMGRRVGFRMMSMKLKYLWAKNGDIRVMDISEDFYLVRFSNEGDYKHALFEGPWLIADHYLLVQRWRPFFTPEDYNVKKIVVWVRIPHLPAELYNPHFLSRAGSKLGTMLKIDETTSIHTCGRFTRICIDVDLSYQLIPYFNALGHTFKVEYEGLHMICFECGKYGHKMDFYPDKIKSLEVKNPDSVSPINKAQEVGGNVQDSNCGGQEINKSPRRITKVNSKNQEGGVGKLQGDQVHNSSHSGTRFEILSADVVQDCEVNLDNSHPGKDQTPKAHSGNLADPSHTKDVIPKPVKHYNQNQKVLSGNSKKNYIPLKIQKKPVVIKDSQAQEESSSKKLSPRIAKEQGKKKDWEKEILAMMSRYHSKRWEAHSNGEYVGDPLSLDKKNYFEIMKDLNVDSSHGKSAILDLDRPPDITENGGTIDQSTYMDVQISPDHPTVGTVAQPKEVKENLIMMPSHEEIKQSLFSIGNFKAPGPDGMHALFYKSQWDIVAPTVVDLITQVWTNPSNIKEINQTLITLVPTNDSPTRPAHFRPI
ncbi:hypothetical protein SESBI_43849 [Sesbania bispinosa]|nr:hypothetical protein SESBI_43849 [Sesbania bispinosa]